MQFTTTPQKEYISEANATDMNTAKKQKKFLFFEFRKTMRYSKHNKKIIEIIRKLQNYRPDTYFRMCKSILWNCFLKTQTKNCGRN